MTIPWKQSRPSTLPMQESSSKAFETLFADHWARVYGLLYRLVGDPAEAEDLALEVFWRLYQRAGRNWDPSHQAGWLYRVATNLGYNALRDRKRRQYYEQQAGKLDLVRSSGAEPEQAAEASETRERVRQVLARMNPRSARILILRHSGLSYAEVAAALNIAPGSVGTLLTRAEREFQSLYPSSQLEQGGGNDAPHGR